MLGLKFAYFDSMWDGEGKLPSILTTKKDKNQIILLPRLIQASQTLHTFTQGSWNVNQSEFSYICTTNNCLLNR